MFLTFLCFVFCCWQDASSPHMPRHVLESITQSPTQSRSTPPSMSYRYQDDYYSPQTPRIIKADYQNRINGDFVTQQSLYREQYLQQTGIMNSPAFAVPRKQQQQQQRDFKSAQMTWPRQSSETRQDWWGSFNALRYRGVIKH